jgi:hypothetical protein
MRSGWHSLLLAGLLGLPLAALVPWQTEKYYALWLVLSNAGHLPLFGLFATGLFFVLPHRLARRAGRYVTTAAISYLTVIGIEVVQPLVNRTTSMEDAIIGMLGVALALGGIHLWERQTAPSLRLGYAGLTMLILVCLFGPAWNEARVVVWSQQHFPLLGDFEDAVELRLWRVQHDAGAEPTALSLSEAHATSGRKSLEVRTGWGTWHGVRHDTGRHSDWRAFRVLRFDVYNPGRPFYVRLRLKDADRQGSDAKFIRQFDLQPGWNDVRVPLTDMMEGGQTRMLDLGEITQLALYTGENEPGHVFFLDHVRLE